MISNLRNLLFALIVIGLLLLPSQAEEETVKYCDSMTLSSDSPSGNFTLPLFDPGLGNLVRVDLTADSKVVQSFSFENQDQQGQSIGADSETKLSITLPDSSLISVNASTSVSEDLAAYDGEMDYKGSSGKMIEGVESKGSAEAQYQQLSDFTASVQNETISLPADVSVRSMTSGNIVFSLSTVSESEVCVTYTYEPSGSEEKGDSK